MKKITKSFIVFLVGLLCGYYICINNDLKIFDTTYKAFQVGVYTSLDAANTYKTKYKHLLIDEMQDTDKRQAKFVESFLATSNVFLCGDCLQNIIII